MTDQEAIQRCLELSPLLTWMNQEANLTTAMFVLAIEFAIHMAVFFWVLMRVCIIGEWVIGKLWTLTCWGCRTWQVRRIHEN